MPNVVLSKEIRGRAKACGLNITGVCRRAVSQEIARIENEIGANAAKQIAPTIPVKETP